MRQYDAESPKEMEAHKIIKAMRLYLGSSQEEVAKKAGISNLVYLTYENEPGYIMRGKFSEVCKVLKALHLNPWKFYQGKYILSDAGYKAAAQKGRLNYMQLKLIQRSCPVSCRKNDE